MPELPEVECARRLVVKHFANATVTEVTIPGKDVFDEKVFDGMPSARTVKDALTGLKLEGCGRHGKVSWWTLRAPNGSRSVISFHFGMSGSMSVLPPKGPAIVASYERVKVDASSWPPAHCKLALTFSNGCKLAFTDPRRFGRVRLGSDVPPRETLPLAPDCYTDFPRESDFRAELSKISKPIKAVLLDQNLLISGIGNYLADEVLYQARIHPESHACALDDGEVHTLHAAIKSVVNLACDVDADAARFPSAWLFHRRWTKGQGRATTADGHAISFVTVGGRTSAVVVAVQGRSKTKKAASAAAADGGAAATSAAAVATAAADSAAPSTAKLGGAKRKRLQPAAAAAAVITESGSTSAIKRKRK